VIDADPALQASLDLVWTVASFLFGAIVGSFLNVVIARVPERESIVSPGSRCPICRKEIRFYDNIPVLSYLILLGRCRNCGHRISIRYPIVELMTACLGLGCYWKFGISPPFAVFFLFCAALVAVFWIDIDHMIIPNVITLNGMMIGVILSFAGLLPYINWKIPFNALIVDPNLIRIFMIRNSLVGLLLGGAILYIPAKIYEIIRGIEGLGGGDIKLLAMIGAFTGPYGVIFVLFVSSMICSVVALAAIAAKQADSTTRIPFGPFLAASAVLYVFAGAEIISHFFLITRMA
jgi:leader peptidase (prepilin peptidase) / N-methyltransferase